MTKIVRQVQDDDAGDDLVSAKEEDLIISCLFKDFTAFLNITVAVVLRDL